jgi:hypothetical protein
VPLALTLSGQKRFQMSGDDSIKRTCFGVTRLVGGFKAQPEDLKDVPIAVGLRAGSHFNVPYRLEQYLPLEHIKTVNVGGFGARLKSLLDGGN